jgi:hypothetical protein
MKVYGRMKVRVLSFILNFGTSWRRVVTFKTWQPYPQGKSPWRQLDKGLGGQQSRYEL